MRLHTRTLPSIPHLPAGSEKKVDLFSNIAHTMPMLNKKGTAMQRYAIYQLPFENENSRDLSFMSAKEVEEISDQFEFVGIIDGRSLEDVFHTSNCCDMDPALESLIERIEPMHSLSVGDIVHNLATDETFMVDVVGFKRINMKECA
jgi:hypothetical protein